MVEVELLWLWCPHALIASFSSPLALMEMPRLLGLEDVRDFDNGLLDACMCGLQLAGEKERTVGQQHCSMTST